MPPPPPPPNIYDMSCLSGTGARMKEARPEVRIIALYPALPRGLRVVRRRAIRSGGMAKPHAEREGLMPAAISKS